MRFLYSFLLGSLALPLLSAEKLDLAEVLQSVKERYPPYLVALIEQDVRNGQVREAQGAFDTQLYAAVTGKPSGFYDGQSGGAFLEQPLSFWGGGVYSGYRLAGGSLAEYDKSRTQRGGQVMLGFRLPLLQDGVIDKRRTDLFKAQIGRELADPLILRQYLDMIRSATLVYYEWVTAGYRLGLSQQLLDIAKRRQDAIRQMVLSGAQASIVEVDNERLVVSRELGVVSAQRELEMAAIKLSLFYRNATDQPQRPGQDRLPISFPNPNGPSMADFQRDLRQAQMHRPEVRSIALVMQQNQLDQRLARNQTLPQLDLSFEAGQSLGRSTQKDIEDTELEAAVKFSLPLQRRQARGQLDAAKARQTQLELDLQFTRDRIEADVYDAWSAIQAARLQIEQAQRNVELAEELEKAEEVRFQQGAADLLALQIREKATFDARIAQVNTIASFFVALANYHAATAAEMPASMLQPQP